MKRLRDNLIEENVNKKRKIVDSKSFIEELNEDVRGIIMMYLDDCSKYIMATYFRNFRINKLKFIAGSIATNAVKTSNINLFKLIMNSNIFIPKNIINHSLHDKRMLKFLRFEGYKYDEYTLCASAINSSLETFKFLINDGCEYNKNVFFCASYAGCLDKLDFLNKNHYIRHEYSCRAAAATGNFKILKWLYENGCTLDVWTLVDAIYYKNKAHSPWIKNLNNGILIDTTKIIYDDETGKKMLYWLISKKCQMNERCYMVCIEYNDIETIKFFYKMGCPMNNDLIYSYVGIFANEETVNWFIRNHNDEKVYSSLSNSDRSEMMSFWIRNGGKISNIQLNN